jgi:mannosyltransferase
LFNSGVGLLAAFLLAISPLHVYYSQEVRMYGLVALLSAGILAVAAPIFARGLPRWRDLVVYLLLITAALYTQYYAVFLPVGLTIYAIWNWRRQPAGFMRWLVAQMMAAILYLPWVLYATPRLIPYVSQKVAADADRPLALVPYLARHLATFLAGHLEGPLASLWPFALLLLLFWAVDAALWLKERWVGADSSVARPGSWAMLMILIGTSLLMGYAISRRYPFFPQRNERLLLLALPPFILLSAAVLADLWHRVRSATIAAVGLAVLVAAASLLAFYTVPRYPGDDYRPLLARIVEQGRPEDTLFAVYPWQMGYWRSYGDAGGPSAVLAPEPTWGPAVADALDGALARGHVWFPAHLSLGGVLETRIER